MATINQYHHDDSSSSPERKVDYQNEKVDSYPQDAHTVHVDEDPSHSLHRNLGSRQITMIAIGGAIGTGLIIGT